MDYIITAYPTMYRRYLVKDVQDIDEAWDKYYRDNYEDFKDDYQWEFLDD